MADTFTGGMPGIAIDIMQHICAAGFHDQLDAQQVMCLVEEAGEFAAAFRRYRGWARRSGTFEEVRLELADVVIAAFCAAEVLGIDLERSIEDKLAVIYSRGWRDSNAR